MEMIKINSVLINNNSATIVLSEGRKLIISGNVVIDHQLVDGIVLTDSQLKILETEAEFFACNNKIKQYLAAREHSSGQLKMKLKKKSFSTDIITQIIKKYKQLGLIDDERYAFALAEKLLERKPCGRAYLISYLQQKMIDRGISERIAEMVYANQNLETLAYQALEKKWYMYTDLELEDARNKSYNYLARRGFSFETAKSVFEKVYKEKIEE